MAKLRSVLGYSMAVLSSIIMVALFPAIGALAEPLIMTTGLILSPKYTGGEVTRTIDHGTYQTQVHRMVFDDVLIGERKRRFMQVGWTPPDTLPARIDEEIDADGDGQVDFRVEVDTASKETTLTRYASWVLDVEGTYGLKDSLAVRVTLRNASR
jgi:hypothetical protein